MAVMTTVLEEISSNGDSRTYMAPAHTVTKPVLVLQKRKVASGNQVVAEDTVSVLQATVDAAGDALPQKILFTATYRRPITGAAADVTSGLALFREIVASDEFTDIVNKQSKLQ